MTKYFSTQASLEDEFTVISLHGELDAETNAAESDLLEFISESPGAILIDCKDLTYISSAGVSVFLSVTHACRTCNKPVTFFHLKPKIRDVLNIIGLSRLFSIATNLEEAKQLSGSLQHKL